ncbi:ArsA family ATPase [Corynebacterium sp. NPDC060344]|uniref:ArsA family ATPase n=1 Tax=Corynebacterium sp. NPDC060344 TaxID=3347101 RepID=UPI00364D1592
MSDGGARVGQDAGVGGGFATSRAQHPAEPGAAAVHVITGKGGTGKSTVAGALALRLASGGGRVLLVEVEGRPSVAATLGLREFPRAPHKVASALGGGEVHACSLDAEAVLEDYMSTNVGSSLAIGAARKFGVTEFATAIAPGLRDVLLSGFVVAEARRGEWSAVVVDAPPTGRVARFLDVTRALGDIATTGPIHRQAADTAAFLRSASTRVHMVTLAEPLPVRESLEALAELSAAELPLGSVVANRLLADDLCDAALSLDHSDVTALAGDLGGRGGEGTSSSNGDLATALLVELDDVAARARVQRRSLTDLAAGWPGPVTRVPALPGGVRIEGLYDVAELLTGLDHREVRDE